MTYTYSPATIDCRWYYVFRERRKIAEATNESDAKLICEALNGGPAFVLPKQTITVPYTGVQVSADPPEPLTWHPTSHLRWEESVYQRRKVLQQLYKSSTGQTEWRDVPTEGRVE